MRCPQDPADVLAQSAESLLVRSSCRSPLDTPSWGALNPLPDVRKAKGLSDLPRRSACAHGLPTWLHDLAAYLAIHRPGLRPVRLKCNVPNRSLFMLTTHPYNHNITQKLRYHLQDFKRYNYIFDIRTYIYISAVSFYLLSLGLSPDSCSASLAMLAVSSSGDATKKTSLVFSTLLNTKTNIDKHFLESKSFASLLASLFACRIASHRSLRSQMRLPPRLR